MQGQGLCAAASLRSAISGSKGQRRKNLSRKAMRANRHCFTLPATSKGAGFLLTLWDHPLSSHDASRTVCLGPIGHSLGSKSYASRLERIVESFASTRDEA